MKQLRKNSKAGREDVGGVSQEDVRRIEVIEVEMEEHRDHENLHYQQPEHRTQVEHETESEDTTSLASFTTSSLLGGRRVTRFDETMENDLEVLEEEDQGRHYLDDVFAAEPWRVLLSDDAYVEVKQLGGTQQKVVLDVLKVLASGTWYREPFYKTITTIRSHNQHKLRCLAGGELNILWGLDMEYSREQQVFTEVIQIWHVVRPEQKDDKADMVMQQWQATSRKFEGLKKALESQHLPKLSSTSTRYPRTVASNDLQDSDVFSVRKFFALDRQMLHSITMDDEHAGAAEEQFALRVSKREAAVIEKKGPAIVIGRSGSGKTLCCVYRLFYEYLTYWKEAAKAGNSALMPSDGTKLVHLHQVFVTHSASLANKVLEYFSNLQAAQQEDGPATKLTEQTRLPDTLKGLKTFPLFVTFRKFIIMVDGSLEKRFFPRRHTGQLHPDKVIMAEAPDALDPISALREQTRTAQRAQAVTHARANPDNQRKTEVDYELFKSKFWPKISPLVSNQCDASLLWREIQSFIKGSYKVMDTEEGHLSLPMYAEVAKKASPGFEDHRPQIYKAFQVYEQLRKEWNCFDRMDVSFHVVKELKKHPYNGPPIHSVAVDEVQDLAQIELAIFFMIMKKPYEELFITGDTSQAVSRAVDFRFCDLRSLFHYFNVDPVPELDQLLINYRSHQKILALSHKGVVRPLELAFPYAIDKLQADEGHRDGEKPVVVDDVPLEDLARHVFNLDGSSAGIAFGASQCILVRNEESRKRLPKVLSNSLVLTVEQSKGLEFDDCILVNFFKDSLYKEWQTVKIFLQELINEDSKEADSKRPRFDRLRHTLLCSELKHLYTAITRTKHVLLIIEEDMEQAAPMFELWAKMDLVNFGLMQEENSKARRLIHEHAGKNRGKDSWCTMGHNLMKRQLYQQALSAFQRGEDENMAKICEAYMLAQEAARTMEENEAEGVRLFRAAAELFVTQGARQEQGECLLLGQRPLEAARIFESLADELGEEQSKIKAARAYAVAGRYATAARLYEAAKHIREAIENFLRADADEIDNVKRLVLKAHSTEALSTEECFRYLQDTDAQDVAGELFFAEGNYVEAAKCFESAGLLQKEADCYLNLGKPLLAADRLSSGENVAVLLQAANLYRDFQEHAKEAKCCRTILENYETDNMEMLDRCISLHKRLGDWRGAAELLEKTDFVPDLIVAVQYYEEVRCYKEAGQVSERLAANNGSSRPSWLQKAAALYKNGGHNVEQLQILEQLCLWQECGELACSLKKFAKAADFFFTFGDFHRAVECRLDAKDFEGAYSLLEDTGMQDIKLEIKCLEGLHKYNQAARRYMEILPPGGEERAQMALKAFEVAFKCKETCQDFLKEFRDEMPNPKIALKYFLEIADTDQICDQLLALKEKMAAVAAASILGEPLKAIQLLDQQPGKQEEYDWLVLDILLVAVKQKLNRKKLLPLLAHVNELWNRAKGDREIALLNYVDAVISRQCNKAKKGHTTELTKSYKQARKYLQEGDHLAIGQELAMLGSEKDLTWTLSELRWYIDEVTKCKDKEVTEWPPEILHLLRCYYQALPDLHKDFFDTIQKLFEIDIDRKKAVAKCHRLAATECKEVLEFSGAVVLDLKSVLDDLEETRLELLQKLSEICKKPEDLCKPPGLWLEAFKVAKEERKMNFKDGFLSSLRAWASNGMGRLTREVEEQIPEAVKDMWHLAREDAEPILRKKQTTSFEFNKLVTTLQRIITEIVALLRQMRQGSDNESVAKTVSELVLKDLKTLMPICPHYLTTGKCTGKDSKECPLDHPEIGKMHEAKQLLHSETGRYPVFNGLGLHGWLQLVNVCQQKVRLGGCKNESTCKWLHPEDDALKKIQESLSKKNGRSYYGGINFDFRSLQDLEAVAKALHQESSKIPHGFGCCFFKDETMMLNVRLVTILASAMFSKRQCHLGLDACSEVLKRMCRSLYRYPDPEAADVAKKTLEEIRNLETISNDITWEVDGAVDRQNDRCLLSLLLGRQKKRNQVGAIGAPSTLRAEAAEFVSGQIGHGQSMFAQPERRAWVSGNFAEEFALKLQQEAAMATGGGPIGASKVSPLWKPVLHPS